MKFKRKQLFMLIVIGVLIAPVTIGVITMGTNAIDIFALFPILSVLAAEYDTAIGNFTLDAIPTTTQVNFVDASFTATETLTPDDSTIFGVNATVALPSTLDNLDNVTFYIYDDSIHATDWDSASPNGYTLIVIDWQESDDTWTIDQGSLSEWTMQSPESPGTGSSETTFDFCARFDMSKITRADTTDWNATVVAWDNDTPADSGNGTESALVTVSNYFQLDFIDYPPPFTWGTVDSNTVNATTGTNRIEIIANAQWELAINSTDFNATGESDVDIEVNDVICLDLDGAAGAESYWIRNTLATVAFSTWDNQAPLSTETAQQLNVYILLSTSNWFDSGAGKTWNTSTTIWCQANT